MYSIDRNTVNQSRTFSHSGLGTAQPQFASFRSRSDLKRPEETNLRLILSTSTMNTSIRGRSNNCIEFVERAVITTLLSNVIR